MKRRLLCFVLALTMMLSMMPVTPFVASAEETEVTYDDLVGAINTILDRVSNMEGGARHGFVLLLEDAVESEQGIADLQEHIKDLDRDNNGVLDELPEGEEYYFTEYFSIRIMSALTSRGYTVIEAARAIDLFTIWDVEDRIELVKSLESDDPKNFFATTDEMLAFRTSLLEEFPDLGELFEAEKKSLDEFSFFAFAARQAIGSSIFTDDENDGTSIKFIDDDRFTDFITKMTTALDGITIKGRTFDNDTVEKLFEGFENVLKDKIAGQEAVAKQVLGNYGLYQSAKLPSFRLVPVYGIIDNEETVDVDVVLEYINTDINALGLQNLDLDISYSDKLSLKSVKDGDNKIVSDYLNEVIDTDTTEQISYSFTHDDDNTFTVDGAPKAVTLFTLEFIGIKTGEAKIEFVGDITLEDNNDEDIVFSDYSGDTTTCDKYSSVMDVRDATVLPTEITYVYLNGAEVDENDTITIASNDFTVSGYIKPTDDTVKVNNHSVEVSEDKGAFSYDFTGVTESLDVTIEAGNDDTFTFTVNIDTEGPVITVTDENNKSLNNKLYNIDKTINIDYEDETLVSAILTGSVSGAKDITSGYEVNVLDNNEEDFTLVVVAKDELDNETTKTVKFTIDKIKPEISIVGAKDGGATSIIIGCNEGKVEATLNDVAYTNNTPITKTGHYELIVTATDDAGNITIETRNFYIDTTAPKLSGSASFKVEDQDVNVVKGDQDLIISFETTKPVTAGYLNVGTIDIRLSINSSPVGDKNIVSYDYKVPNNVSAKNVPISVVLIDAYGNKSDPIDLVNITIDNTDPNLYAYIDKETQNGYVIDDTNTVTVTIETDGHQITYDVSADEDDNINATSASVTASYVTLELNTLNDDDVTYTVNYTSEDIVGNTASNTLTFKVDNVAPETPTVGAITSPTNQDSVVLTVDENEYKIIVKENNKTIKESTGLSAELDLNTGENKFVVYAEDEAGNISEGTDEITIVKDITSPLISIEEDDNRDLLAISNEEISFTDKSYKLITDGGTEEKDITLTPKDGADNTYIIGGVNLEDAGKHVIIVEGTDIAGNVGKGKLTKVTVPEVIDTTTEITDEMDIEEAQFEEAGILEVSSVDEEPDDGQEFIGEPMEFSGVQVLQGESVVIDIKLIPGLPENLRYWYLDEKDDDDPLNDEWIELNGNEHGDSIYNPSDSDNIENYVLDPRDDEGNKVVYNGMEYEPKTVKVEPGHLVAVLHHFSTYAVMVDMTAPEINITFPNMGDVINKDDLQGEELFVSGTLSESCEVVTINGIEVTDAVTGNNFIAGIDVTEGDMTITVSAIDASGNHSTKTVDIFVDTESPEIVTFSAIEKTRNNPDNIKLEVSDTNDVVAKIYETSVAEDNIVYITTLKDQELSIPVELEEGDNTFIAVLADEYGNEAENETINVFLDSIPSEISIEGVSDKDATAEDVNITVSSIEAGSTWTAELVVEGVVKDTFVDTDPTPYTVSATSGEAITYVLGVKAEDKLGNKSYEEISFTIDTTLPTIDIIGITDETLTKEDVTINVSQEHADTLTTALTKDNAPASFENGDTLTKDGEYSLLVIATKTIGEKTATKTVNFTIDKVAPEITVSGVKDGRTYTGSATPVITFEDNHSENSNITTTITLDGADYESGTKITDKKEYILAITATDEAGNEATKEITFTVKKPSSGGGGGGGSSSSSPSTTDSATVSTKGGTLELLSDDVVITFEEGTFDEKVKITVEEIEEDIPDLPEDTGTTKLMLAGKVYELNAEGKTFGKPVKITLPYDKDLVTDPMKLGIYRYNEKTEEWDYVGGVVSVKNGNVTVILDHFSKYAVMGYDKTFTDVTSHWAKDDIELMAARHIANGMTTTTFAPQGKITRAQFATLLVRALGLEISENDNSFADVNDEWFAGYVTTAFESGLVNGMNATKFAPEANVTREQMATMIMRAYSYKTNNDYNNIATSTNQRFNDESNISSWAHHAVLIANDLSIINGMGDDMFAPKADATRAQAIVMIKRLLEATDDL